MVFSQTGACVLLLSAALSLQAAVSDGNHTSLRMLAGSGSGSLDASPWNAVDDKTGFYGVLVHSGKRVIEDSTKSVQVTAQTDKVASVQECAEKCFLKKKCQWFKLTTSRSTTKCSYYQHLELTKTDMYDENPMEQYGFVKGGDVEFLNQNVQDSKDVFKMDGHSFYNTTSQDGKTASVYIAAPDAKCTTTPLTLYRSFQNYYQTKGMIEKVKSGDIINSMDDTFTLQTFMTAVNGNSVKIPTQAVDISPSGDVVRTGEAGPSFDYRLDHHGRVARASAHLTYKSLLRKPGQLGENGLKKKVRDQYCRAVYQDRFNDIQSLGAATDVGLPFQAGHLFACQFTNPNGFFNFVPQSVNSNAKNGCWYNTELMTSRLLKMGCEGDVNIQLTYMDTPGDLSEVHNHLGVMMSAADAEKIYNSDIESNGLVQRPCGFFYRPIKMSMDFTITGAVADSKCSRAIDVIKANNGKFYEVDATNGAMAMTRAFAYWSYETPAFNRVRGMATADWQSNQCYAETGSKYTKMVFANVFEHTFLKVKMQSGSDALCLAMNDKQQLQVFSSCDKTHLAMRWWFDGTAISNAAIRDAGLPNCIKIPGDKDCVVTKFIYLKQQVSFDGETADIKDPAELVDGALVTADETKCLAITDDSGKLEWKDANLPKACFTFQTTYQLDGIKPTDNDDDE